MRYCWESWKSGIKFKPTLFWVKICSRLPDDCQALVPNLVYLPLTVRESLFLNNCYRTLGLTLSTSSLVMDLVSHKKWDNFSRRNWLHLTYIYLSRAFFTFNYFHIWDFNFMSCQNNFYKCTGGEVRKSFMVKLKTWLLMRWTCKTIYYPFILMLHMSKVNRSFVLSQRFLNNLTKKISFLNSLNS